MKKIHFNAFVGGFMAGLAAPTMLFADCPGPRISTNNLSFQRLYRPAESAEMALRGDMRRVGNDMKAAIKQYEQETASKA